jgi:hypothetical protein
LETHCGIERATATMNLIAPTRLHGKLLKKGSRRSMDDV